MAAPGPAVPCVTARAVVSGFVLSLLLCAMNSFLTLKFGVIEEGPTIAALFFFAVFCLARARITIAVGCIVAEGLGGVAKPLLALAGVS